MNAGGVLLLLVCCTVCCYSGERCYGDGDIFYDQCNRRCQCIKGNLTQCCRERRDFLKMPLEDRRLYIQTVLRASSDPKFIKRYNHLVSLHVTKFEEGIHKERLFLPWHRWYILQYENLLREIDCRVTVPFWDYTVYPDVTKAPWRGWLFDMWNEGEHAFGGNGDPRYEQCVTTGPFAFYRWNVTPSADSPCLTRDFVTNESLYFPTALVVEEIKNTHNPKQYEKFAKDVRVEIHNPVHEMVCGLMCDSRASNDPVFWLLHAFTDKVWYDWQSIGPEHMFNAFYLKNATNNKQMISSTYKPSDFIDFRNQTEKGVNVCYT